MPYRILPILFFLLVSCEVVSAQSEPTPQQQAEDIIHHVLESYDARLSGVTNYTVLVKDERQGGAPAIEYYERVPGEYTRFRLVTPDEDSNAEQIVQAMGNALDIVGSQVGLDLSDQSEELRGIEFGNDDDDNGALGFVQMMNIVADYATQVGESSLINNGYYIEADVSESPQLGGQADIISLHIYSNYTLYKWFIQVHGGPTGTAEMWEINEEYGFTGQLAEPICISHHSVGWPAVPDTGFLTLKVYKDVNLGAPSEQRKVELLAEALEDFQNICSQYY